MFIYRKAYIKTIQGITWVIDKNLIVNFLKDFPKEVDLLKLKKLLLIIKIIISEKEIIRIKIKVINYIIKIK